SNVFRDHVPDASKRFLVQDRRSPGQVPWSDLPKRLNGRTLDRDGPYRVLALGTPRVIRGALEASAGSAEGDDEPQLVRQGDRPVRQRPAVEEERGPRPARRDG